MSKYLIIKCEELSDQYECEASKTPIKITNDCSKYGMGYEVWEILMNGNLKKVKNYDTVLEEGFAVYFWDSNNSSKPNVIKKFKNLTRKNITKSMIKNIKEQYTFTGTVNEIFQEVVCSGHYGEPTNEQLLYFGEYCNNYYSHY